MEAEKGLSHDNLVAIAQRLTSSLRQSFSTIDKGAVGRSQIFQDVRPLIERDPGVAARDLRLRIVGVQVYVGKDSRPHPSAR